MAKDLPSSKSLRAGLRAAGKPDRWNIENYPVQASYPPHVVQMHAVKNDEWQRLRLSLKGRDTTDKLQILQDYWNSQVFKAQLVEYKEQEKNATILTSTYLHRANAIRWAAEVQVGNYLGALRRGGQLNDENQIRKAR